jgi:hypothetical protein
MLYAAFIGVVAILLAIAVAVPVAMRRRLYGGLAGEVARLSTLPLDDLAQISSGPGPDFGERLATLPDFLPHTLFSRIQQDAERLVAPERSYIPTHKKGGTVAYETVIAHAPALVALYQSNAMREWVSKLVGEPVRPTPIHDQSSLSVLFYDKPGDHIGWHFDHNFYRGRHFTVLLPVLNTGSGEGGLSHARLTAMVRGTEVDIATPPNTLVVFEGARVRHKVAPIIEGERRMVVSMTYCADPREGLWQGLARRVKDTAFFGLRALWT